MPDNYRFALNTTEKLNFQEIPAWVEAIARQLLDKKYQAFLVGGAVRDLIRGILPHDWDLATDALPEQIETLFPQTIPIGKQFGSITVVTDQGPVEITTLRKDFGYNDGRHPNAIQFSDDILCDLARRDFTINALAYDFSTGELVDPFRGRRDIDRQILRAVGNPERRFAEDGLRMFRFYRFLATQNLRADHHTRRAINPRRAEMISYERIRDEFSKLLLGEQVRRGLTGLSQSRLLKLFIPELQSIAQSAQDSFHQVKLWDHLITTVETIKPELIPRLAALLHDIAKPATRFVDGTGVHFHGHELQGAEMSKLILERMRYPNKIIESVSLLIRWHMFQIPPQATDGAIRRLIARAGPESIPDLLELRRADIVATGHVDYHTWQNWRNLSSRILKILQAEPPITQANLAINGHDLIACFNLKPGPLIGRILESLTELVWDDPGLNQKEILLKLAKEQLDSEK